MLQPDVVQGTRFLHVFPKDGGDQGNLNFTFNRNSRLKRHARPLPSCDDYLFAQVHEKDPGNLDVVGGGMGHSRATQQKFYIRSKAAAVAQESSRVIADAMLCKFDIS